MTPLFLNLKKLNSFPKVRDAIRHNKRAIHAEMGFESKFRLERSALNHCLISSGSAEDTITEYIKLFRKATGAHPTRGRKNGVYAVEILVSVGPSELRPIGVFQEALDWVRIRFGCPIISADVHLDESSPHIHFLILPLVDGRLRGSDLVGGPGKLNDHRRSFYSHLGYEQPKVSKAGRNILAKAVVKHMQSICDPATQSPVWEIVRTQIAAEPVYFAQVYGITARFEKQTKTPPLDQARGRFINIMIRPQKSP